MTPKSPKAVTVEKFAEDFLLEAECGETTFTHEFRQHLKNKLIERIKLAQEEARAEGMRQGVEVGDKTLFESGKLIGFYACRERAAKVSEAQNPFDAPGMIRALSPHMPAGEGK